VGAVQFRLLGGLEVVDDEGVLIDVGGAQLKTVLAALVAACGRVVTTDALVDAIWGDTPPASATGTLQTYVSRLRRALGRGSRGAASGILRFEPPGYRLGVKGDDVDFVRFEALADEGRDLLVGGDPAAARKTLLEAEALWRGPALAEYRDRDFATGLATRLEERRAAALEDRVSAELALGRHAALVGELNELVRASPWQEGLRASLALALYRSGRQADALRSIEDARRELRDELGVDPGRPLQELEASILDHDPALDLAPSGTDGAEPAPHRSAGRLPVDVDGGVCDRGVASLLVGRTAELHELVDALPGSTSRVVILEGEPGIGKTRLAEEVAAVAQTRGMTVLWGRAFEGGAAPALWPWLPPLRALADLAPAGSEVAPDLRRLLAPAGDPASTSNDPGRYVVFEGVVSLVAACAVQRPVVILLDDIQWADRASLELLRLVGDRLRDEPVLLVCTVRELEVGRNDEVVETLAALTRRSGTRLVLRGLDPDASADLARRTSEGAASGATIEAIHERSEGNPFFVTQLARLIASGAGLGDIPAGVRDVVRRRLADLPAETVALLEVAAVAGREFELALLTAASGAEFEDCLNRLEPALVQRLVVVPPEQPSVYRFAHALVREVVVDDVSTLKQARLHRDVAESLREDDDTIEIIAEHLWSAVPIGMCGRAADALERASKVAVRRLAYDAAQDHLERAAQLRRTAGNSVAAVTAEAQTLCQLVAVTAARQGHASVLGSPLFARAKQLTEQAGMTPEHLNLLWVEWAGLDLAIRPEAHPAAERLLAVATTHPDDPRAVVLGHTAFGINCWHVGRLSEAATHLDTAARHAPEAIEKSGAPFLTQLDQIRISSAFGLYVHDIMGDLDDPDRRFAEVIALVPGDVYWELLVTNFEASGALSGGDLDRAVRVCERGIASDPEGLSQFWSVALRCYLGAALCAKGDVDRGFDIFDPAWNAYCAAGLRTNSASWLASRAHGLALAGRVDDAQLALAESWTELETYGELYAKSTVLLADAVLAHARGDDPTSSLREAIDVATTQGARAMAARVTREAARLGLAL
jgi:DNA-binding SARP family transcriptional activator